MGLSGLGIQLSHLVLVALGSGLYPTDACFSQLWNGSGEGGRHLSVKGKLGFGGSHGAVWSCIATSWVDDLTRLGHNFLFYLKNEGTILDATHP